MHIRHSIFAAAPQSQSARLAGGSCSSSALSLGANITACGGALGWGGVRHRRGAGGAGRRPRTREGPDSAELELCLSAPWCLTQGQPGQFGVTRQVGHPFGWKGSSYATIRPSSRRGGPEPRSLLENLKNPESLENLKWNGVHHAMSNNY